MFATKHSASSCDTSIPDIRSEQWNMVIGILDVLSVAIQLFPKGYIDNVTVVIRTLTLV